MIPTQNIFVKFSIINQIGYLSLNYELFELNDVGQYIWECIDGQSDLTKISGKVATKYNTQIEMVEEDVKEFIHSFVKNGLVEI